MNKNMYSLVLMDRVVVEIDNLACSLNTNRSNLVNQILAQHLNITTPEMQIKEFMELMTKQIGSYGQFRITPMESEFVITIKSPLNYKYRPTIKYSLELYRYDKTKLGELRVSFRTKHSLLLERLEKFFTFWVQAERSYIHQHFPINSIIYSIESTGFRRTIMLPADTENPTGLTTSDAVCRYIHLLDETMKMYLYSTEYSYEDIANHYLEKIQNGLIIV